MKTVCEVTVVGMLGAAILLIGWAPGLRSFAAGAVQPLGSPPPPGWCPPIRVTKYMGRVLRPAQFRVGIADYAQIRADLNSVAATYAVQVVRQGRYLSVFAGRSPLKMFRGQGEIQVVVSGMCQLGPVTITTTDRQTGPLTLTKLVRNTVHFTFPRGHGTFNLATRRFALYVGR